MELPAIAEDLGFDGVWLTDHVIGVSSYAPLYGPTWLEGLTCLAHIASTTTRLRLGMSIMVVPYRQPVMAAKVLATIDQLSGGRLDVGVGLGWSRAEHRALGVGHLMDEGGRRGEWMDECLDLIKRCWQGGTFGWSGRVASFREITFDPVPVQRPGPPLWVGGWSEPALRRCARIGDVWHPTDLGIPDLLAASAQLDALAGRSVPIGMRLSVAEDDIERLSDKVAALMDAGVADVILDVRPVSGTLTRKLVPRMAAALGRG